MPRPEQHSVKTVIAALKASHWNRTLAAEVLEISRPALYGYFDRHPEILEAVDGEDDFWTERGKRLQDELYLRAIDPEAAGSTTALKYVLEKKYAHLGYGRLGLDGADAEVMVCMQQIRAAGVNARDLFATLGHYLTTYAATAPPERGPLVWQAYVPQGRLQRLLPQLDAIMEPLTDEQVEQVVDTVAALPPATLDALALMGWTAGAVFQYIEQNAERLAGIRNGNQLEEGTHE